MSKKNVKVVESKGVEVTFYFPKPKKDFTVHSTCVGSPYTHKVDLSIKDGKKIAEIGAKLDVQAMINASLPSTDITAIVARAKMGDESVLHVNQGFTGDTTVLPKDIYDYKRMNDLYDKVSSSFNQLPDAVKSLFGNSEAYLNAILDGSANKIVSDYKASQEQEEKKEEVNNG